MNKSHKSFIGILVVLAIIKLWLDSAYRITVDSVQYYDDALFMKLAMSIRQGNWLGAYNNLTLVKYPLYSIWLAINNLAGMPLLASQSILYCASAILLAYQLRKLNMSPVLLICLYVAYLFNPFLEMRILREGIYSSSAILVLAMTVAMYNTCTCGKLIFVRNASIAGVALSIFWLLREEGLWLFPMIAVLFAHIIITICNNYKDTRELCIRLSISAIPFLLLIVAINGIASINYHYYGTYVTVEQKSKPFTQAYGALLRVNHSNDIQSLQVPRDVREKLYEVSPSFRELMPYIDGDSGNKLQRDSWIHDTCILYPESCPDYGGTWFMWAFRDAVASAGYYATAPKAIEYYARLAREINGACDNHLLACEPVKATIFPAYKLKYTRQLIDTFWHGVKFIFTVPVQDYVLGHGFSRASYKSLKSWHDFTNEKVLPINNIQTDSYTRLTNGEAMKLHLLEKILIIYKSIFPFTLYAICICFVLNVITALITCRFTFLLTVSIGIMFSIIARLLLLSYIDIVMFPAFHMWQAYMVPFYPFLMVLLGVVVAELVNNVRNIVNTSSNTIVA